jgi:ComF family protein
MDIQYSQPLERCQPKWRGLVDSGLTAAARVLWRSRCVLCHRPGASSADLCNLCERDLLLNTDYCRICAQPLAENTGQSRVCGGCVRKQPLFDASFVPYRYAYPLDRMIQRLKYGNDLSSGRVLGQCFYQRLIVTRTARLPEALLPVPLGIQRFRKRGYNQAIELARHVATRSGIPLRMDIVARIRETQEQASLPREERRKNVKGAFALIKPLAYAHIAILDDVVTTGTTVNEIARVLRRAGAETIEVWAIARAGRK